MKATNPDRPAFSVPLKADPSNSQLTKRQLQLYRTEDGFVHVLQYFNYVATLRRSWPEEQSWRKKDAQEWDSVCSWPRRRIVQLTN
ncbi:hypothetical protein KXD40_009566 [Peronospora effusa]|nr:hypothetical protein KXD40_009566 [Peronospora effusa]